MNWKIPLFMPDLTEDDAQAASGPIRDAWLTMGERTRRFEERFANALGSRHAFAVANGTAALELALAALRIKTGDEVLLPSLTFVACANAVKALGATPVFVDARSDADWTICPDDLERKITPKSRAVMCVHYAGYPCRMDAIQAIAKGHNLAVIEDCAHALVSTYQGRHCGTWGDVGCFSFFSNKNMTCGEGGMVAVQDDSLAERIRLMRSHGMTTLTLDRHKGHAFSYDVLETGYNFRMDEIHAALALNQFEKLRGLLEKRRRVHAMYVERLRGVEEIIIPFLDHDPAEIGIHIFPVLLQRPDARAAFMQSMKDRGMQTSIHYPPIHHFTAYQGYAGRARCPLTDRIGLGEVTLPFYPSMSEEQVEAVCGAAKAALA